MLERGKDSIAKFQQETTRYFIFSLYLIPRKFVDLSINYQLLISVLYSSNKFLWLQAVSSAESTT